MKSETTHILHPRPGHVPSWAPLESVVRSLPTTMALVMDGPGRRIVLSAGAEQLAARLRAGSGALEDLAAEAAYDVDAERSVDPSTALDVPPFVLRNVETHEGPARLLRAVARRGAGFATVEIVDDTHHRSDCARTEAATDRKSAFLAQMSHELRTPMYGIVGMLDLALEERDAGTSASAVASARACAEHLLQLLNDLLDLSKIEADQLELSPKPTDVDRLAQSVVDGLREYARKDGITLTVTRVDRDADRPRPRGPLEVDDVRLRQILTNLVSNAVKFSPEGGLVEVRIDRRVSPSQPGHERVRFEVVDEGIGIEPERVPEIFGEYGQVAEAQTGTHYQGTGLGLPIVKSLVDRMGGAILVDSTPCAGSTFCVDLTLERSEVEAPPAGTERRAWGSAKDVELAPARVLLAEDNVVNQRILARTLERGGHGVRVVGDGEAALRELEENPGVYDFVLMDIQMPVLDGLETTRRIRQLERDRRLSPAGDHIPIIALTASAMDGDDRSCFDAGADGYLTKPLLAPELFAEMARLDPQKRPRDCA